MVPPRVAHSTGGISVRVRTPRGPGSLLTPVRSCPPRRGHRNGPPPVRVRDAEAVIPNVAATADAESEVGAPVTVLPEDREDGVPIANNRSLHGQSGRVAALSESGDVRADGVGSASPEAVLIAPGATRTAGRYFLYRARTGRERIKFKSAF